MVFDALVMTVGVRSTPLRHAKPTAQLSVPAGRALALLATLNCVVDELQSKKAQVPPQIVASSKTVVGTLDIWNELVWYALATAVVALVTVVFAANAPVDEAVVMAIRVLGVVNAG